MIKRVISYIALCLAWIIAVYQIFSINKSIKLIEEDNAAIYELIMMNNNSQYIIVDTVERMLHYMHGHNSNNPILMCPECGLLNNLSTRKMEIDEELSNPLIDKNDIYDLEVERKLIEKHLYLSDEKSMQIRKSIIEKGEF